uniref:Protein kinase domain-containing protein n=1 Tax=Panagrellus redivivus TaxID=6233 RepID=A0A7E4V597_PANRE
MDNIRTVWILSSDMKFIPIDLNIFLHFEHLDRHSQDPQQVPFTSETAMNICNFGSIYINYPRHAESFDADGYPQSYQFWFFEQLSLNQLICLYEATHFLGFHRLTVHVTADRRLRRFLANVNGTFCENASNRVGLFLTEHQKQKRTYNDPRQSRRSRHHRGRSFCVGFFPLAPPPTIIFSKVEVPYLDPMHAAKSGYFDHAFGHREQFAEDSNWTWFSVIAHADEKPYTIKRSHPIDTDVKYEKLHHQLRLHESLVAHMNIAEFIAAWQEGSRIFVQMGPCQIPQAVSQEGLPNLMRSCASVMTRLHGHRIVNSFVGPMKMLIGDDGHYKYGDFGSAHLLGEPSCFDAAQIPYLSPEVKGAQQTKAGDVYILGVKLLEIVSGANFSMIDDIESLKETAIEAVEHVQLRKLLKQMTDSRPDMRPEAVEILYFFYNATF